VLAGATVLLAAAAGLGYARSEQALHRRVRVPAHPAPAAARFAATPAARAALVARGAHVAATRGCADCHGATFGGAVVIDDPLAGRLAGPNLTAGGRGPALADADWELALRHGVRRDGSPLVVMPSTDYAAMTDEDVAAVAAYARSLPAVRTQPPPMRLGPLLRALHLAGKADVVAAHTLAARDTGRRAGAPVHVATVAEAPTREFGAYVATTCTGCHGAALAGGAIPGAPPDWPASRNITPHPTAGIGRWTEADFERLLTTGVRPDGQVVDTVHMPVRMTRAMTAVERRALWAYLRTVPSVPAGAPAAAAVTAAR
jgi:mono/diheme cytochrome c family protein